MCLKVNPPGSRFCNYCGSDLNFTIQPDGLLPQGAVLRGSYVIENVIGEGGMGVVYRCHHKTLGTRYALKVLEPKLARIEMLRQRFLAEAKIQATVIHPHIVHVLDVIDSDKDGGIPGVLAIVMEYVEGESLDAKIEDHPLSEKDAVSTALVVLDAIGFAHHAGIVHRDLKPSNIMISSADAKEALYRGVKVMDFGIAKLLQENENDHHTVTGTHMGTLRYMAPEQIQNARDVDERTDLYAIGLTLYELLCGRTPFEEYREFELINAKMSMKPPSMKTYRSDISDRLEAIVMKSLEKDRANRYPNAESFQRALLSLGGYDDIPLMLNPYEGTAVLPTNQKLQKKIERAIAKSNEAANGDAKANKGSLFSAKKSSKSAGSRPITLHEIPADGEKSSARANGKQGQKTPSAGEKKDKGTNASFLKHAPSHKSIVQLSKENKEASAPGTPSKTFKRSPSKFGTSSKKSRMKTGVEAEIRKQNDSGSGNGEAAVRREEPVAAKDESLNEKKFKTEKKIDKRSEEEDASKKVEEVANKSPKHLETQEKVNTRRDLGEEKPEGRNKTGKTTSGTKAKPGEMTKRPKSAIKIVVILLIILICGGVIYRHYHKMPIQTPAVEMEANRNEAVQERDSVVDDVSQVPFKEIETETGRMTVIPAARHWISQGRQDELHPVELPAFAIDQHEVSYYDYMRCVEAGKCAPVGQVPEDINKPVTQIGYGSAEAYCKYAGKALPSAAQWEAAARFGGTTNGITDVNVTCENIHFGAGKRGECQKVNANGPESVFWRVQSSNPGHLLNMLGNVREWTSTADKKERQKYVTKGGSYLSERKEINISVDTLTSVNSGEADLGFRCIREQ